MDGAARRHHGSSFDRAADVYERARPSYPDDALDWLLPTGARRLLDLGAGTGKLTRQLVERGLDVVAVEPLPQMRARLRAVAWGVDARSGAAEAIPLPDGDVDAVLVAQAWHWFDHDRAVAEIARVLRPGGTLGLIWNTRDEREPWVRELSDLMQGHDATGVLERGFGGADGSPYFGPVEAAEFTHRQVLDRAALLDLVRSRSHVIVRPEAERAALLDDVTRLAREHPALAGRETFALPYVTRCHRTRRTV